MREGNPALPNTSLCKSMFSPHNIGLAVRNVKRNNGSAGIDGMKVSEIEPFMRDNWPRIEEQILARKYKPKPVRRVEIPKDNGGVRLLGVPCVIDRVIQQMMVQVLQPLFEPTFSEFSYGFRPNRSAEDAVRKAQEYMAEGYNHVVDLDLSKFFDRVNHDLLMTFIDRTLEDKDIRRLIYVYLKSGVMSDGSFTSSEEGTPQGGPLSPLLSNIYLTPYDKELERRGLRFVRYADDCNIFTKTGYSCRRVKESAIRFLENKMKLKVNMEKTEARRAVGSSFLGFTFLTTKRNENGELGMCKPKASKLDKFKQHLKEITSRSRGVPIRTVIDELNTYLRGWMNYYARSSLKKYIREISAWIRRRLRQYLWKQWKTPQRRREMLNRFTLDRMRKKLNESIGFSSNSYWKMSGYINYYLPNQAFIDHYHLIDIEGEWEKLHAQRMNWDRIVRTDIQLEFGFTFD